MAWTLYRNQQFEVIPFTRFRGLLGLFFPVEVRVHGVPLKFFFFFFGYCVPGCTTHKHKSCELLNLI